MRSVAVEASWSRPTRLSRFLDGGRYRRVGMAVLTAAIAIGVAFATGYTRDEYLTVDPTRYVSVAALFVALRDERWGVVSGTIVS